MINKTLFTNIISLGTLQILNYLLPLITVPYLLRTIGIESFGILSFANVIIGYFLIFTDYGFNWSASRQISLNRDNNEKVSEIFSSVIIIKGIFLTLSFLILIILILLVPIIQDHWFIYIYSFGSLIGQIIFPLWLFQGLEKMKFITIVNIIGKVVFTVLIFLFVSSESDYYLVAVFNSLGFMITGLVSLIFVKKIGVKFKPQPKSSIIYQLKDGLHIFLSTISISLYTLTSTLILGLFTNYHFVGVFSSVDKIVQAAKGVYYPFSQALYPMIGLKLKEGFQNGKKILSKMLTYVGLLMLFISIVLFTFSDEIVFGVLGNKEQLSALILKVMSPLPFVVALGNIFGVQIMLNLGYNKEFGRIVFFGALIGIILTAYLSMTKGLFGTALSAIIVELFITMTLGIFTFKKVLKNI